MAANIPGRMCDSFGNVIKPSYDPHYNTPPIKTEFLCNMCGQSCILESEPFGGPSGLIDIEVIGGYNSTPGNGSGALDDYVKYKFSLCEFCLDWLFGAFVIPVKVTDGEDPPMTWKPAMQRVTEDKWRQQKERFYEAFRLHEGNRRVYMNNKYDLRGNHIPDWAEYRRTHDIHGNAIDSDGNLIVDKDPGPPL